jgi:LysR family nitrogen assimilation transcriptional regulator
MWYMDVGQLKTLIHVAELGSLSKAADRLHIAQPALSRQIRLLEKELGATLFDRHGRGMVITTTGQQILDHATRVMTELQSIRMAALEEKLSHRGTVTIGTTPTVSEIVTVPLVKRIREAHPQLAIRLQSAFTGHLLDWLQRDELDLAVLYNPQPQHSLRVVPVMMENLLFIGAGGKGLSLDRAVPFSHLANEELVLPSRRHGLRAIMEECASKAGIELHGSVEADSFGAMINLVRSGFGSTALPLAPIYPLVDSGVLCAAPLVDPTPTRKLVLAFPADRPVNPAARFVAETFTSIATDLVRKNVWVGNVLDQGRT